MSAWNRMASWQPPFYRGRGAAIACALAGLVALIGTPVARAMVGGALLAEPGIARHILLIVGSRGNACTGVAIARDLVLTVAHCVLPGADYKWVEFDGSGVPSLKDFTAVTPHPQFDLKALLNHRATADVALLRSAEALPGKFVPAPLAQGTRPVAVGDRFLVAGYGVTIRGDGRSGGKIRTAILAATGHPGALQIRLVDPATGNAQAGLGACTGDSGAPVFDVTGGTPAVVGLVSWSTAARNESGCGGLTGVTPLERYRAWVADTAASMGSMF